MRSPSPSAPARRSSPPRRSSPESAIEFEHDPDDNEEVVERFKDFLDRVTPEDFAGDD